MCSLISDVLFPVGQYVPSSSFEGSSSPIYADSNSPPSLVNSLIDLLSEDTIVLETYTVLLTKATKLLVSTGNTNPNPNPNPNPTKLLLSTGY